MKNRHKIIKETEAKKKKPDLKKHKITEQTHVNHANDTPV